MNYLQLMISFPKHFAVFNNFFRWFTFYFLGNRINFISTIFFMETYKLIEITFAPICKSLYKINEYIKAVLNKIRNFILLVSKNMTTGPFNLPVRAILPFLLVLPQLILPLRLLVFVLPFEFSLLQSQDQNSTELYILPCFYSGRFLDQEVRTA